MTKPYNQDIAKDKRDFLYSWINPQNKGAPPSAMCWPAILFPAKNGTWRPENLNDDNAAVIPSERNDQLNICILMKIGTLPF